MGYTIPEVIYMLKFCLACQNKWIRIKEKKTKAAALEKFLNSPQFKQVLFDVQNQESERLLFPGNQGQHCLGNPELCDECDYLICCFDRDLCRKCFAENGFCEIEENFS